MTERASSFDQSLYRVIGNPTGAGAAGPLAADYLFGLGADPFNDNVFPMPAGNLRFPSYMDHGGGFAAEVAFYQNKSVTLFAPPAYEFVSLAWQNNGVGGTGCGAFRVNELTDPGWDGIFGHISGLTNWVSEQVTVSNDPSQTNTHTAGLAAERAFNANAVSPFIPGGVGGAPPFAMQATHDLYNDRTGTLLEVNAISGYGQAEFLSFAVNNGATSQFITHWVNEALVPAGGDGPTWWVEINSLFGHFLPAAGMQAYQTTGDATKAWGWKAWAVDDSFVLHDVLDVTPARGLLNGATIATADTSATTLVSPKFDLTVAPQTLSFIVPAIKPGYFFAANRYSFCIDDASGATATGTLEVGAGNNATFDNTFLLFPALTAATFNTNVTNTPPPTFTAVLGNAAPNVAGTALDAATEIKFHVSSAFAGVTAHGRFVVTGAWVKI